MENKGYVYIFSNSAYSGLLKIGKSKKNPVIRANATLQWRKATVKRK
jgi:hypothetical protein